MQALKRGYHRGEDPVVAFAKGGDIGAFALSLGYYDTCLRLVRLLLYVTFC